MAIKKIESVETNHNIDMVSRKLVGSFATMEIDLPWEFFEQYVDSMLDTLDDLDLVIDKATLIGMPEVEVQFHDAAKRFIHQNFSWDNDDIGDPCNLATRLFSTQIKEQERKQAEERRIAELKMQEERKILELTGEQVIVPQKHLAKARAILIAAGLIKG